MSILFSIFLRLSSSLSALIIHPTFSYGIIVTGIYQETFGQHSGSFLSSVEPVFFTHINQ